MPTTDAMGAPSEEIAQHARAGERVLEVQFVDLAHQCEVGVADRGPKRSKRSHETGSPASPDGRPAKDALYRLSLCARPVDTSERVF